MPKLWGMPDRPDLAAMAAPLTRALMAAETPILREHGLSMWAYAVLLRLDERPVRTQAALAESIGADKTRIISVLDELQRRGLIERSPDPADRRVRLLSITPEGRRLRDAAQAGIRRMEERLLSRLPDDDKEAFVRVLRVLSALPSQEFR
ncbi:DNA-binding transcriptional regulator, MarR family [Microbispora rosea]|uniref:DNA-binding transcriptional regulator, MarR family n=1 Tax=Microbispora rosea TaxID=58117 RepID=A0A1N7BPK6_9ACTN|nr:MarR family transcriptional regulator [Microbispora rosea]GIH46052.1 putative transcriptional regulator, MarR family protein [Microbispora rosea subsp. rosea]SIR53104.1 DNA-binding transcriptional regulator, MarR family [Microbispora rosea]